MRDLFLLSMLPFLVFVLLKRPFVAAGLWIWTAMFFPNYWVYGIAGGIRYNLLFSIGALISYALYATKINQKTNLSSTGWLVLLFLLWGLISSVATVGTAEISIEYWGRFAKGIALFVFMLLVLRTKTHLDFFLWCILLSISAYGVMEGAKYISSGGAHKISGMGSHILGDRNHLALSLVMTMPICVYFIRSEYTAHSKFIKYGFLGAITLLVLAVLGTQSRGGLISLVFLAAYFISQSKSKISYIVVAAVVSLVALSLVPDEWFNRMNTIESANEDGSFMTRVVSWKLSLMLALENPVLGGGIKSLESPAVWQYLSFQFHNGALPWFPTGDAMPQPFARAAHSVYFQVLGELGFGGLLIFFLIFYTSIKRANRIIKNKVAPTWMKDMAQMLKLSLLTYLIGSAALSLAYFEGVYALIALLILLENNLELTLSNKAVDLKKV